MTDDPLKFEEQPALRDPVLVLAYSGWSDAGDAATQAARYLTESEGARKLAHIDLEEFLDFTVVRPHVRLRTQGGETGRRAIVWPSFQFWSVRRPEAPLDLVVGLGVEPHTRWKAYTRAVLDAVRRMRVRKVVMLAALFDEVIYSQPVPVSGFAADPRIAAEHHLQPSRYEGPTGITGVLADALQRADVASVSIWARLPHYVSRAPYTRGALALLQRLQSMTGFPIDLASLERQSLEFEAEVSEMITNDPQLSAYVRELKRRAFSG